MSTLVRKRDQRTEPGSVAKDEQSRQGDLCREEREFHCEDQDPSASSLLAPMEEKPSGLAPSYPANQRDIVSGPAWAGCSSRSLCQPASGYAPS